MKQINIKRGAVFAGKFTYNPLTNSIPNLLGINITAQVRTPGGTLVSNVIPTIAPDGLSFSIREETPTAQWPLGVLRFDFRMEVAGLPLYSETIELLVERGVTNE